MVHKGHLCHAYVRGDGLAVALISDEEYPPRVAFSLIQLILEQFTAKEFPWKAARDDTNFDYPELQNHIIKFQDPSEADKLMKIQKDIDETRDTVIKTIDQLLQRGEKYALLAFVSSTWPLICVDRNFTSSKILTPTLFSFFLFSG